MNNKTPLYILTGCVLLYVLILPNIDYDLLQLINSVPVKMIFALLIITQHFFLNSLIRNLKIP